jgi:hemolysin activation/secretion protein
MQKIEAIQMLGAAICLSPCLSTFTLGAQTAQAVPLPPKPDAFTLPTSTTDSPAPQPNLPEENRFVVISPDLNSIDFTTADFNPKSFNPKDLATFAIETPQQRLAALPTPLAPAELVPTQVGALPLPAPITTEINRISQSIQLSQSAQSVQIAQAVIPITKIEVVGNTALKPADLEQILVPLTGRSISREDLQKAIAAINELYLKKGFITSRVVLDEASVVSGNIQLRAIEGSIESIQVEGNQRLRRSFILSRLRRGAKAPLNVNALETELRYLRANPLFEKVESSLKAGTKPGQSILTVRVQESKRLGFDFGIDNYIPPSVAPDRAFAAISYRNLSGIGDQIAFSYAAGLNFGSLEHAANYLSFNYRVPVNAMDGTVELQANYQKDRITEAGLDVLGIEGKSQFYQITYRQPIIRQLNQELALSLGLSAQGGQTFLFNDFGTPFGFGPDANGVSRTRVLRFGQEYARRDGSGVWSARSQFNFGLGILNATENPAPIPDGRFFSWTGQVQRLQSLGKQNLLVLSGNFQLTPNSLLPSEQFVIGGNQTVRGYPQSARSGDMGYRFGIEGRFPILRERPAVYSLQLLPFAEVGQVFNLGDNPNKVPGPSLLGTVGLGVMWQPIQNVGLRIDYGIPLVDLGQNRNRSLQDLGFNFSLKVGFLF